MAAQPNPSGYLCTHPMGNLKDLRNKLQLVIHMAMAPASTRLAISTKGCEQRQQKKIPTKLKTYWQCITPAVLVGKANFSKYHSESQSKEKLIFLSRKGVCSGPFYRKSQTTMDRNKSP
ncbi:hypothetical protein TNCV_2114211 [Trichonephila clavipes]|nr:hypothetical protein TNCV_2114211 [Trichonephila clavipes]